MLAVVEVEWCDRQFRGWQSGGEGPSLNGLVRGIDIWEPRNEKELATWRKGNGNWKCQHFRAGLDLTYSGSHREQGKNRQGRKKQAGACKEVPAGGAWKAWEEHRVYAKRIWRIPQRAVGEHRCTLSNGQTDWYMDGGEGGAKPRSVRSYLNSRRGL